MDVKNKVDKDVVENVVKEDAPTKPDANKLDLMYELGRLAGHLEVKSNSEIAIRKAKTTGMFMGAGALAIGYIVGRSLTAILSNKHHN